MASISQPTHSLVERVALAAVFRNLAILRRIATDQKDVGFFIVGAATDLVQESHRARRVGQGDQAGGM